MDGLRTNSVFLTYNGYIKSEPQTTARLPFPLGGLGWISVDFVADGFFGALTVTFPSTKAFRNSSFFFSSIIRTRSASGSANSENASFLSISLIKSRCLDLSALCWPPISHSAKSSLSLSVYKCISLVFNLLRMLI